MEFINLFTNQITCLHNKPIQSFAQLYDIQIIFQLLQNFEPTYFDATSITTDYNHNIQLLINSLNEFFNDTLGYTIPLGTVNVNRICSDKLSKHSNSSELMRLCNLCILCCVNSPTSKDDIIESIMSLSEQSQTVLMNSINNTIKLMTAVNSNSRQLVDDNDDGVDVSVQPTFSILNELESPASVYTSSYSPASHRIDTAVLLMSPNHKLANKRASIQYAAEHDTIALQQQLQQLTQNNKHLTQQLTDLHEQVDAMKSDKTKYISAAVNEAISALTSQHNERMKTNELKHSKQMDQLSNTIDELHKQTKLLNDNNASAQREKLLLSQSIDSMRSENQQLRDDIQLNSSKVDGYAILQVKLERLQQKLDSHSDHAMNSEVITQQNQQYEQQILELQSKLVELNTMKQINIKNKETIAILNTTISDLKLNEQLNATNITQLNATISQLHSSNRQLSDSVRSSRAELDVLKEELSAAQSQQATINSNSTKIQELTSKITTLTIDNLALKQQIDSSVALDELQTQLNIAITHTAELEDKYLDAQRQLLAANNTIQNINIHIEDLQQQLHVATLQPNSPSVNTSELQQRDALIEQLRCDNIELNERLVNASHARFHAESTVSQVARHQSSFDQLQSQYNDCVNKLEQSTIRNKKLETFVKNAHDKVRLSASQLEQMKLAEQHTINAMNMLKQQISDKDRELRERDVIRRDEQKANDRERKLVASAFYTIGIDYTTAIHNNKTNTKKSFTNDNNDTNSFNSKWLDSQRRKLAE